MDIKLHKANKIVMIYQGNWAGYNLQLRESHRPGTDQRTYRTGRNRSSFVALLRARTRWSSRSTVPSCPTLQHMAPGYRNPLLQNEFVDTQWGQKFPDRKCFRSESGFASRGRNHRWEAYNLTIPPNLQILSRNKVKMSSHI